MSIDAYIGEPLVLQVLYLDDTGVAVAVLSPTVTLFRYHPTTAAKVILVTAPVVAVGGSDPGRYIYRTVLPTDLVDGMVLYAEYRATDPGTGHVSVTSEVINVHARGLRTQFVR